MSEQLTNGEIAVLNAARSILRAHTEGYPDDFGQARVITLAETAEHAIFLYLNNSSTWGGVPMTPGQVHNASAYDRPTAVEPQSLKAS